MDNEIPSVFDMDIGKDPDDTCVAAIVGLNPEKYNPALIISNDESQTKGRARFLSEIIKGTGAEIPVASGLPSLKNREDTLVERMGLIPRYGGDFIEHGISYLIDVLDSNESVNYFGLGALTNLSEVLKKHPEFSKKINLIQMGPAFEGVYRKPAPQYNVRIDIPSFYDVLRQVNNPRFLMSHASWEAYDGKSSRQQIGIYVDDPISEELRISSNPALNLFAEHLRIWKENGISCSIMHDPLTVLSSYDNIVDYAPGEILFDENGFANLTDKSKSELQLLDSKRLEKLGDYVNTSCPNREGLIRTVEFSLNVNYDKARRSIVSALFNTEYSDLADKWKEYNSTRLD